MQAKPLPALEYLRQCLRYEPDTGHLYWLERPLEHFKTEGAWKATNTRCAGKRALTADAGGGLVGHIDQKRYSTHRIAYYLGHGVEPSQCIDHINGDYTDNRLNNLRDVSVAANARNRARNIRSGAPENGVYPTQSGGWVALITVDKKQINLGTFETLEEAIAARIGAERACGFHENHGRVRAAA